MLRLTSNQDHCTSLAGFTNSMLLINKTFPTISDNTRTINARLYSRLTDEMHGAMHHRAHQGDI